ncbi:MAG: ATP-NAD kinase-like domain-containing protein [Linnemannia gamsii]|nr:MAG: ATP-NAD kinase-like domain-containing protein [Linnemannia gamsii]
MGIRPTSEMFPLLLVLNPNAGKKIGQDQLSKTIQPALDKASVPFRLVETTGKGFAQSYFKENIQQILVDLVQSIAAAGPSPEQQEGEGGTGTGTTATTMTTGPPEIVLKIMVVGGDGTVHEVINGVLQGILDSSSASSFVNENFRPKIELSIIPTGTGNAIATSQGVTTTQAALDRFLAGKSVPLRVVQVSQRDTSHNIENRNDDTIQRAWRPILYTVVVNSFGLHCSTVFDAEGYRSLGNTRFKVSALKNIVFLKQYEACMELFGPVQKYDRSLNQLVASDTATTTTTTTISQEQPSITLPGPFTYLMLTKQSSLEPGFVPTPFANTSDEWLDVLAVQNVGRGQILEILGDAAKEGRHVKQHEKVEYFKAKVVEIETPTEGRLCVDGEFLDVAAGSEGRVRFEVISNPNIQLFNLNV